MTKLILSVSENTLIRRADDAVMAIAKGDELTVSPDLFDALKQLATDEDGADSFLNVSWQKGREAIRVRNYVGLLLLPNGTQLEILPKIWSEKNTRVTLLTMLRQLRHSPFRAFTTAHTTATHLPLWEVFITAFLDAMTPLIQQGVQHAYLSIEQNERFWKGKFQATRQQRENAQHAERLAVVYDRLMADVPPNRILKATLLYLNRKTTNRPNQYRIRQFIAALDEVPASDSMADDLMASRRVSRLFRRYEPALAWAEALMSGQGYGVKPGNRPSLSLLFPMERVFEDYVGQGVRKYWPDAGQVMLQESSAHLVDEHVGTPKFKLRPDILIRHNGQTMVFDTKWKQINGPDESGKTPESGNYGIEQADLYQLYAYGKKYEADNLFLVYPANPTFRQPLAVFGYDATTRLHVVPFDVANSLSNEVEKLAAYALSF